MNMTMWKFGKGEQSSILHNNLKRVASEHKYTSKKKAEIPKKPKTGILVSEIVPR